MSIERELNRLEAVPRPLLCAFTALVTALALAVASYLVLRQPQLRQWLLDLVPHRYSTPMSVQRQLLAPRSILLAGLVVAAAGALVLVVPRWRAGAFKRLSRLDWATMLVFCFGSMLALAPVVDMEAFYLRQFGRPAGVVPRAEVMEYLMPQAYPDAQALKARVPANARIALTDYAGDAHNMYLLNALVYPVALYDATQMTSGTADGQPPTDFLARNKINALLRYDPKDRANPLWIRKVN